MASVIPRSPLTQWMKSLLEAKGLLVGLGEAPKAGGWNDDPERDDSYFVQYVVLTPQNASEGTGPLSDDGIDWTLPYSVSSHGSILEQAEEQADIARKIVNEMKRVQVTLSGESWKVMDASVNSIGGVVIDRNVKPSEFAQTDIVSLRLSKERI